MLSRFLLWRSTTVMPSVSSVMGVVLLPLLRGGSGGLVRCSGGLFVLDVVPGHGLCGADAGTWDSGRKLFQDDEDDVVVVVVAVVCVLCGGSVMARIPEVSVLSDGVGSGLCRGDAPALVFGSGSSVVLVGLDRGDSSALVCATELPEVLAVVGDRALGGGAAMTLVSRRFVSR